MTETNILIPEQYDVVVIGAGAGGLTAAGLLAKAGLKTVLFESDTQVGGYLAGFNRSGFHFNTSIEWLNHCQPGGFVHTIFAYLGGSFPECPQMNNICRFKSNTFDYLLTSDPYELRDTLIRDFPGDARGIRAFFEDSERLGERLCLLDRKVMGPDTMAWYEKVRFGLEMLYWSLPIIKYLSTPIDKGLRRYFRSGAEKIFNSHESLMSVMVSIAWASSGNMQSSPLGGSAVLAGWLHDRAVDSGARVELNQRVECVLLDDRQHACGVKLTGGLNVNARFVVAACDLQTLYEKMLPDGAISARLLKGIRTADVYYSYFTIYLGLSCNPVTLGFGEETLHLIRTDVSRSEQCSGDPHLTLITVNAPSVRDPSLAPPGKGTLTIHCPAYLDSADEWHTGSGRERGEAYRRYKESFANILLDRVEAHVAPGLRQYIEVMEIATPVTFWRYTGNTKGSIMGAMPTTKNILAGVAHYRTPVKNLLVGGHCGEYGGGVPLAVKAATNASLIILKELAPSAYYQLRTILSHSEKRGRSRIFERIMTHFWFKCLGTMGFTAAFFGVYIYLLKNPVLPVTTMPITEFDRIVSFEPLALPIYLSLWLYVSLPPMLMHTRRELIEYGLWIGSLCLTGLVIFYLWPTAVPPANIDWARYPGVAFLKGVDAAGNACPSLHVAAAVFSAFWINWLLPSVGLGRRSQLMMTLWCVAIVYSTLATKQHVAVDVFAGGVLGCVFAWLSRVKNISLKRLYLF